MGAQTIKPVQRCGNNDNNELTSHIRLSERCLPVHPQGIICCLFYRRSLIICGCVDVIKIIPIKYMKEYEMIKSSNTVGVYKLCEINDELFASVDGGNNIHIWNVNKKNHKLIKHIECVNINDTTNQIIKHLLMLNYNNQLLLLVHRCNTFIIIDVNMCHNVNTIYVKDDIDVICTVRNKDIVTMNCEGVVMIWEYVDNNMIKKLHVDWNACDRCFNVKNIFKLMDNKIVLWDNNVDELIEINVDNGKVEKLIRLQDKYDDIQYIEDYVFIGRNKNGICVLNIHQTFSKSQVKVLKNIQKCSIVVYGKRKILLINEHEGSILKLNY